jgi:hypothetical protein
MAGPRFWGAPAVTLAAPADVAIDHTVSGATLDLVFPSSVAVALQKGTGPFSAAQTFAVRAPLSIPARKRLIGFTQIITYGYQKTYGARLLLVAELAGVARTVAFDFDAQTVGPIDSPLNEERVFSVQGLEGSDPARVGLQGPAADYTAVFTLVVERRGLQEQAQLALDGLTIVANIA